MSTAADILKEESALGRWPRRLLHVDTLTSYEWQPGSRYGSAVEPNYAAITYTWGRWKLKDDEMLEVQAIPITGVPWDIPRVNPAHFTVEELKAVIERARIAPSSTKPTTSIPQHHDFVWLDIACIDQRDNNPSAASEMGRQASIFRGASFVYAWLSALSTLQLKHIFESREAFDRPDPEAALHALSELTSDPWFSSLWTLQEAFLRTDAIFLSREGQPARITIKSSRNRDDFDSDCFTLRTAIYFVNDLKMSEDTVAYKPWSQAQHRAYEYAVALGVKTGLYALSLRNPTATFILAKHRTAEREEDRVYGIQQIFDLRLGKTAPWWMGEVYILADLEDEFARQLLITYPVQSQMHVFTKAAAPGTAWRLNESSIFPKMNEPYFPWLGRRRILDEDRRQVVTSTCKLWAEKRGAITGACFAGKACNFDFWTKALKEIDDELKGLYGQLPALTVFLDVTDELNDCPHHGAAAAAIPDQRDLIQWLGARFAPSALKILELGKRDFPPEEDDPGGPLTHGLLLVPRQAPQGLQHYHRIGFCTWYSGAISSQRKAEFETRWTELSGRFG